MNRMFGWMAGLVTAAWLTGVSTQALAANVLLTLTISGAGLGTVTVDGVGCSHAGGQPNQCDFTPTAGGQVTLTASPSGGHMFAGWGGACSGTAPTCTLTMDADKTVTAGFSAMVLPLIHCIEYRGDINAIEAHFGYINPTGSEVNVPFGQYNFFLPSPPFRGQPTTFTPGIQRDVFTATFPASTFLEWTLNSIKVRAQLSDVSLLGCAQTVQQRALSVVVTGPGSGVITGAGQSDCVRAAGQDSTLCTNMRTADSTIVLTATPSPGHAFTGWGGACSGTNATCSLTMGSDQTVTAGFTGRAAVTDLVADPATPGTVYAAVEGEGIYKTTDGGANWTAATTQPGDLRLKALLMEDASTLYAASHGGGVFKSTDAGLTWAACTGQPGNLDLLSLARAADGALYAGSEAGVFVSADGCANWAELNSGLPN